MKVTVAESFYADAVVFDAPRYLLQQTRNPLYIGARIGQVGRVHRLLEQDKITGMSLGAWELGEYQYLNSNGTINKEKFLNHGAIFVAEADRIPEKFRPAYVRLLEALQDL